MGSDLSLEPGPSEPGTVCECCGTRSITVHGFVYEKGDPFAVYYAGWTATHPERGVTIAVATGKWDEDSTSDDRVSMGVDAHATEKELQFSAIDPEQSPWGETELFGRMLRRAETIRHSRFKATLAVAELVVREDQRVHDFLRG